MSRVKAQAPREGVFGRVVTDRTAGLGPAEPARDPSWCNQPLPRADQRQRQPDITLAREHLDWAPTVEPREGLRPTIADFDALLCDGVQHRGG